MMRFTTNVCCTDSDSRLWALRDRLYDVLARNRLRWFGARDSCRLPSAAEKARFLT